MARTDYDAVVVGSGPNGLAAAITMARAGHSVLVIEAADTVGGGASSAALTEPGYVHDVCSAVHPLGIASPFLRSLPLERHGLTWLQPDVPMAHPLERGRATGLLRSLDDTAALLGGDDGRAYAKLARPLIQRWPMLLDGALGPLVPPRRPLTMARFARVGARSVEGLARRFRGEDAPALVAGSSAHSCVRLDTPFTAGLGLLLGLAAHVDGWPVAQGGSQSIADAMAAHLVELGGEIRTGHLVRSLTELPTARATLLDVTPRQFLDLAGDRLGGLARRSFARFRYGAGVCKVDWALSGPVPWTAALVRRAGTVHVGGTLEEIARSEADAVAGRHSERPFVLVAQPCVVDPTRAPEGHHVLWAYCHVPHASTEDRSAAIEAQIERFAPGFRDVVVARSVRTTADLAHHNPNLVGGDIGGGALDGTQLLLRPRPSAHPYRTSLPGVWLCSASTPPGGGVHGMCGYRAASDALRRLAHH